MFARIKKSGKYQYLQIVENRKEGKKVKQRVLATIGRMDRLQTKGQVETLIRSLSRFSERTLLVLSGQSDVSAEAKRSDRHLSSSECGKKPVSKKRSGIY